MPMCNILMHLGVDATLESIGQLKQLRQAIHTLFNSAER